MTIRCNSKGIGKCITLITHDLMANTGFCRIKINSVFICKCLYLCIFCKVLFITALDVMIQSKNRLSGIANRHFTNFIEFWYNGSGIIVSKDMFWAYHNIIAAVYISFVLNDKSLHDLFN